MSCSKLLRVLGVLCASAFVSGCGAMRGVVVPPASVAPESASLSSADVSGAGRSVQSAATSGLAAPYSQLVLADRAIAYYRLNESTSTMVDSGPNRVNGSYGSSVLHGGAVLTSCNEPSQRFPGATFSTAKLATTPQSRALQPAGALSVEAWIAESAVDSTGYQGIVAYGSASYGAPYELQLTAQNTVEFWMRTSAGSTSVKSTTQLIPGLIYHVVGTYDGSTARIYVNGQLQATSASRAAAPHYSSTYGLAIGGALGSSGATFPGSVSDVSIYASALSASQVQKHYTTGVNVPTITEVPASANAFVDSIGVNTHLIDTTSAYVNQYATFRNLIIASGIRHIRDGLVNTTGTMYYAHLNDLAASGIRTTLTTATSDADSLIQSYPGKIPQSFEAYEGPNEVQDSAAAATRAFMVRLHADVKSDPALAKYPILAPTFIDTTAATLVGDVSAYVDFGNIHDYFQGRNPGTAGWGSFSQYGEYGSIAYNEALAGINARGRPVESTETGYGSSPPIGPDSVTAPVLGRYIPRTYLENYLNGVRRTFVYEFIDQNGSGVKYTNYGLVTSTLAAKPSYNAVKTIIATLNDPGTPPALTALTYSLSGNVANVHHLLMEKRDGTYYLAIWIETPSWNPLTNTQIAVPSQAVTISTQRTLVGATLLQLNDTGLGSPVSVSLAATKQSFTVPVTDTISIVHIIP